MKKIRIFCLLAITVMCLSLIAGCGRQGDDGGSTGAENSTENNAGTTQGDNRSTEDRTENTNGGDMNGTGNTDGSGTTTGSDDMTGVGGVIDDIGNGIGGAVDELGSAAGDMMDDMTGTTDQTNGNGTDSGTGRNGANGMR